MNKYLLFYFLFCLSSRTYSQNIHFAEHTLEDYTKNIVSVNSKSFYLERDGWFCNLIGIDHYGNRIFRKSLTGSGASGSSKSPIKVFTTLEKNLLVLYNGVQDGCDYQNFRNLHIQLVDTSGNTTFTASLLSNTINSTYENQVFDAVQVNDSSYYLTVKNELYHYSKSGQFINKKNISINNINCVSFLQNGNLFVNGTFQNTIVNVELDTSGNFNTSPTPGLALKKIKRSNSGKIYALAQNGTLIRYSPQYQIMAHSVVSGLVYTDFEVLDDTVYVTGFFGANIQPYYALFNENLGIIYTTTSIHKHIYPSGISLNNRNQVNIVATGHNKVGPFASVSNPDMSFRSYFQLSKTGTFSTGKDVGVISYKVMDALNINLHDFQMDAEVEVKNFGSQPVHGFFLQSKTYSYYCPSAYRKWVDTLLLPGQTVKVRTGWQTLRGDYYFAQIYNQKRWICFYTSIPDSMADMEPTNDRFCDSVSVLPTGIETYNSINNQVQIFPNPFSSNINIQAKVDINAIKVFNALGEQVYEQTVKSKEIELELQDIDQGIYFMRIETEKGTVTRKVIKN